MKALLVIFLLGFVSTTQLMASGAIGEGKTECKNMVATPQVVSKQEADEEVDKEEVEAEATQASTGA